jgi:hypothetical protein
VQASDTRVVGGMSHVGVTRLQVNKLDSSQERQAQYTQAQQGSSSGQARHVHSRQTLASAARGARAATQSNGRERDGRGGEGTQAEAGYTRARGSRRSEGAAHDVPDVLVRGDRALLLGLGRGLGGGAGLGGALARLRLAVVTKRQY